MLLSSPSRIRGRTPLSLMGAPCPSYLDSVEVLVSRESPREPWVTALGWVYAPGVDSRRATIELTLRAEDEDEVVRFSTNPLRRLDVAVLQGTRAAEWSGFEALAPLAELRPGEYRLGARVCADGGSAAIEFDRTIRIGCREEANGLFERPLLVSVHVPKTAGGSFLRVLDDAFAGRVFHDRIADPLHPFRVRAVRYPMARAAEGLVPRDAPCVHGHFFATKYQAAFPRARTAIWFREPAARIVSTFHYLRRAPLDFPENTFQRRIQAGELDLEGFIRARLHRDVQWRYLDRRSLSSIDFVGIQEQFDRSLDLFGKVTGIDVPSSVTPANVNPDKRVEDDYAIDPALARLIERHHARDLALYPQALARFEELCRRHGV
jgi:hypothetical protein